MIAHLTVTAHEHSHVEAPVNSKPGISLAEIEQWIASRARVRGEG